MMCQDKYNCICQNKKNIYILSIMAHLHPNYCVKIDFQKVDQHAVGMGQGQPVAKPETPLQNIQVE